MSLLYASLLARLCCYTLFACHTEGLHRHTRIKTYIDSHKHTSVKASTTYTRIHKVHKDIHTRIYTNSDTYPHKHEDRTHAQVKDITTQEITHKAHKVYPYTHTQTRIHTCMQRHIHTLKTHQSRLGHPEAHAEAQSHDRTHSTALSSTY